MRINGCRARRLGIAMSLLMIGAALAAQPRLSKYWVEFNDKAGTPYCICRPGEFLSARALDRRAREGVAIDASDLPVSPVYLNTLRSLGARIHNTSRWLNAAAVIADSAVARQINQQPFVRKVAYLGPDLRIKNPPNRPPKQRTFLAEVPRMRGAGAQSMGHAQGQNRQLGIPLLYQAGVRGRGIWVAVLDGGFTNTDTLNFFDSLAVNNLLFEGWDFVERDRAVYESSTHGTAVLSVMGANLPGYFVGTAPEATYFLLKTEDVSGEFPIEEANWVAGAEWADSLGVDVINASLGYTHFNDSALNHTYQTLDGSTAIASRGASFAARKGMIVFNSAGNSGDEPWRHIGVPADAHGLVAVGAVNAKGRRARFSSIGPSADGRVKPDLVAPGDGVAVSGYSGIKLGSSSGTSLASPMLAGAVASLWSAYPDKPSREILDAIFESADQYGRPDNLRGYGIPDMTLAWLELGGYASRGLPNNARGGVFAHDKARQTVALLILKEIDRVPGQVNRFEASLYDVLGRQYPINIQCVSGGELTHISFALPDEAPAGAYTLALNTPDATHFFFTLLFP